MCLQRIRRHILGRQDPRCFVEENVTESARALALHTASLSATVSQRRYRYSSLNILVVPVHLSSLYEVRRASEVHFSVLQVLFIVFRIV